MPNTESRLTAVERQRRICRTGIVHFVIVANAILMPGLLHGEEIAGKACYRYSDNESINAAREIALSLAKRDALEGYAVFVQSTSTVENFTLRNDLINNLAAGLLRNLRVTSQSEDLQRREVCRSVKAEVQPIEIKQQITTQVEAFQRRDVGPDPHLPSNSQLQVLKSDQMRTTIRVVIRCKRAGGLTALNYVRIVILDYKGIPNSSEQQHVQCDSPGQIEVVNFTISGIWGPFLLEVPQG